MPTARFKRLILGAGLTGTDNGDDTLTVDAAAPAGGGGAWTLLSTTTLSSPATFDVSSISGAHNDLALVVVAKSGGAGGLDTLSIYFNNDTSSKYYRQSYRFTGTSGTATAFALQSTGLARTAVGVLPDSGLANSFGICEITIPGYASTAWLKTFQFHSTAIQDKTTGLYVYRGGGMWDSTAAINRVTLYSENNTNLATGSQLRIYGRT